MVHPRPRLDPVGFDVGVPLRSGLKDPFLPFRALRNTFRARRAEP